MKHIVGLLLAIVVLVGVAAADPIDAFNTRPITINPGSETSLQTLLDKIYGSSAPVVTTDQQKAGMWQLAGDPEVGKAMIPILQFEYAGNAQFNSFGMWYGTDTNGPLTTLEIFKGAATGLPDGKPTSAAVFWDGTDPRMLTIVGVGTGAGNVNSGTFTNSIPYYSFGFYLSTGTGQMFYTVDQLNGGTPQSVAFLGPDGRWVLGFEDLAGGGDRDYNDMVVSVESIRPVPEPASILLFGTGILGAAGAIRRKLFM